MNYKLKIAQATYPKKTIILISFFSVCLFLKLIFNKLNVNTDGSDCLVLVIILVLTFGLIFLSS